MGAAYSLSHTYDPAGNRRLETCNGAVTTFQCDAANQLQTSQAAAGTTTFEFDQAGNQQTATAPGGGVTTNTWDGENQLAKVQLPGGQVATNVYNGDGLRVQFQNSTGTHNIVWDGQAYLVETIVGGATTVYTQEPTPFGGLISQQRAGQASFFHFDAVGSTQLLTDSSGDVTDSYCNTAFGEPVDTGAENPTVNPFLFVGQLGYYLDPDTGDYYVRARNYSPDFARWLSQDPMGFDAGDSNLFRYVGNSVGNSPVNGVDPSGRADPVQAPLTITLDNPPAKGPIPLGPELTISVSGKVQITNGPSWWAEDWTFAIVGAKPHNLVYGFFHGPFQPIFPGAVPLLRLWDLRTMPRVR
jgi:RHS repeat-associated protein